MQQTDGFRGLGLAPAVLQAIEKLGFTTPTPIQSQSIPVACEGKDVMGIAQTGTGKTLAFGLPLIQRVLATNKRALIVLPTRELAVQVDESLTKIGGPLGIKTAVLIGGEYIGKQLRALSKRPQIIIGTPGRLNDHIQQKTLSFSDVCVVVLDEADRMLDMGFAPQIKRVMESVPKERQTMLFSATMPDAIVRMTAAYMKLPVRVEIARAGTTADNMTQELFFVSKEAKLRLLERLLTEYRGSVLVFARTKHGAKKISMAVRLAGHTAAELHSNRSLNQRRDALDGFKNGRYRILVATDIAARGIDVTGIELVVNFDLPQAAEDYVHRIGRTARAGKKGHAISFATPDQRGSVREIERLIRTVLPQSRVPDLPAPAPMASDYYASGRPAMRGRGASAPYRPHGSDTPAAGGSYTPGSSLSNMTPSNRTPRFRKSYPQGASASYRPGGFAAAPSANRYSGPASYPRQQSGRTHSARPSQFHPDQYQGRGDSKPRPNFSRRPGGPASSASRRPGSRSPFRRDR